jgi:3-oxoacyl-[acyl-carrier-protein] synthase-1
LTHVAHCSALGACASAAAAGLLAGKTSPVRRELGGIAYPWFALPLADAIWEERARRAVTLIGAELDVGADASLPLFIGSSSLQAGSIEACAGHRGAVELPVNAAAFATSIAAWLGLRGEPWVFSTGCTSGLAALEAAASLIGMGEIDQALALGVELANDTTLAGFASLGLLAATPGGEGLILGEAVAGLRLDARPAPGRSNWKISACRLGVDGYSPTAPTPDGRRIAEIITAALADAGLKAADIGLLKPHHGRLISTDEAEEAALASVFGKHRPMTITLKRALGHTLGASGPAELGVLLALLDHPDGRARYGTPRHVLLNLIGFGGSLAALVLSREHA